MRTIHTGSKLTSTCFANENACLIQSSIACKLAIFAEAQGKHFRSISIISSCHPPNWNRHGLQYKFNASTVECGVMLGGTYCNSGGPTLEMGDIATIPIDTCKPKEEGVAWMTWSAGLLLIVVWNPRSTHTYHKRIGSLQGTKHNGAKTSHFHEKKGHPDERQTWLPSMSLAP